MSIRKVKLEAGKGVLSIMSRNGDDNVVWTHGDSGSTAMAERVVKEHLRAGSAVFAVYAAAGAPVAPGVRERVGEVERTERRITSFDPRANEIVIVPRMQGG